MALLLSTIIAILLGTIAALKQDTWVAVEKLEDEHATKE
jgi:ABC-type dipeptide/oligopeptide/nickel transport system permease component